MLNNCVPRAHSYSAVETEKKISIAVLLLKPYRWETLDKMPEWFLKTDWFFEVHYVILLLRQKKLLYFTLRENYAISTLSCSESHRQFMQM